jgi:hypothetical protein
VIAPVALTFALVTPPREAAIERWLRADRTHTLARLGSVPKSETSSKVTLPADLQRLAARELSVPGRYRLANAAPPAREPWWARIWRWVHDLWQKFWQALFGRVHVGREAAASIGDVLLVLLGLLLIVVVVRLLMNLQLLRELSPTDAAPLAQRPSPRAIYNRACEAAARADYGNAVLMLFAATVALLERRGAVAESRSATVGDLRRALRARNAALISSFDAIAAPFVQRAYADRGVDGGQWERARDAFERLLSPHPQPAGR